MVFGSRRTLLQHAKTTRMQSTMLLQSRMNNGMMLAAQSAAQFSTEAEEKSKHKEEHLHSTIHSKFFEDDFRNTNIRELEFVRDPFYDLGKAEHMKEGEDAHKFIENAQVKLEMTHTLLGKVQSNFPTKESVAFTRYADAIKDK